MNAWAWITQHPAEAAISALGVTTSIAIAIRAAIPTLCKLAELTSTRADDDFLAKLGPVLDKLIAALDVLRRIMPRVVVGPLPRTQPIASLAAADSRALPSLEPMRPVSIPPTTGPTLPAPVAPPADPPQLPRSENHEDSTP